MIPRKITKDEILNSYKCYLSVGDLKKFIEGNNIPDNAKVLIQRVEDVYYNEHHWGVYLKKGEFTERDADGNLIEETLEQYHPAWCCVNYRDDNDLLFIDLHY